MKKFLVFLCFTILFLGMATNAPAVPVDFTYTADNVVVAWFKDGGSHEEISGTTANDDNWRNATTNTLDLDSGNAWEIIWLLVNSDHDSGWRAPGLTNPGGFLAEISPSVPLDFTVGSLLSSSSWEVARMDNFFTLDDGWGDTKKTNPNLAQLQSIYNKIPTGSQWASLVWDNATQWGANDGSGIWTQVSGIDSTAQWIWTAENYAMDGAPDINDAVFVRVKFESAPVPEPATMLLLGVGLIGLAGVGRKRFLKKP